LKTIEGLIFYTRHHCTDLGSPAQALAVFLKRGSKKVPRSSRAGRTLKKCGHSGSARVTGKLLFRIGDCIYACVTPVTRMKETIEKMRT
jgi:hypothetical protein